jgi:hypothetical protein
VPTKMRIDLPLQNLDLLIESLPAPPRRRGWWLRRPW